MKTRRNILRIKKSADRGHVSHGWLDSYHSFSFTGYYNPAQMHFSVLRVINEDIIDPAEGFAMHPHKNMEIITYMLQGELRHEDSLVNSSDIKAGDVQCITAGKGILHSEFNASNIDKVHLLQIWILPDKKLLEPSYSLKNFTDKQKKDQWCLVVSNDGRDCSLKIHQDISLFATILNENKSLEYLLHQNRSAYIQVIKGEVEVNGQILSTGDAAMLDGFPLEDDTMLTVKSIKQVELLLFDLPLHESIDMLQQ
ncbi:MAG: pirin family protein [Methylotenera sp.]|nr:pirin family protein [Methylotenera sp.]